MSTIAFPERAPGLDARRLDGHDVSFVEAAHEYWIDRCKTPSVTQTLNAVQFIDYSEVPHHLLFHAQQRGIRVHRAIHYFLENDLDQSRQFLPDDEMGYFESAMGHLHDSKPEPLYNKNGTPISVEFRFWQWTGLQHGGTVDYVCLQDGVITIKDWKTGEPSDVAAPIQSAAYERGTRKFLLAYHPHLKKFLRKPIRREAVKLYKDGRPGKVHPYNDPRDILQFDCALSNVWYRWRGMRHA